MSSSPRVLQATAWYPPDQMGGTEMYVSGLVKGLRDEQIDCTVIRPQGEGVSGGYVYDGGQVITYPVNALPSRMELRSGARHLGFDGFLESLRAARPAIYHQHSWSRGMGLPHLQAARAAGAKTVLTVHTPNINCLRGTMMHYGREPCEQPIGRGCAACWLQGRGMPEFAAEVLGQLPSFGRVGAERPLAAGRLATALSSQALVAARRRQFDAMVLSADRIVVVCDWLRDAFLRNGVPYERLTLSRQGVDEDFAPKPALTRPPGGGPLRLGFLGRWHPTKGIDLLVKAVRASSTQTPVRLAIYAVGGGPEEQAYEGTVRSLIDGDPRIEILPPASRAELPAILAGLDVLAIPSQWLETGPLVALEAQAAGLAILASDTGGLVELVREDGRNRLLHRADAHVWTRAIENAAARVETLRRDRRAGAVRTMRTVATEMAELYRALAKEGATL